jgi:hypothetical protein
MELKTIDELDLFEYLESFNHTEKALGNRYIKECLKCYAVNLIQDLTNRIGEIRDNPYKYNDTGKRLIELNSNIDLIIEIFNITNDDLKE